LILMKWYCIENNVFFKNLILISKKIKIKKTGIENKDNILFVVDCSPSMFVENKNFRSLSKAAADSSVEGEVAGDDNYVNSAKSSSSCFSPFVAAMKCISATMQNKIISSENDKIGVLFYSTVWGECIFS
jgi:hypothetical protein